MYTTELCYCPITIETRQLMYLEGPFVCLELYCCQNQRYKQSLNAKNIVQTMLDLYTWIIVQSNFFCDIFFCFVSRDISTYRGPTNVPNKVILIHLFKNSITSKRRKLGSSNFDMMLPNIGTS